MNISVLINMSSDLIQRIQATFGELKRKVDKVDEAATAYLSEMQLTSSNDFSEMKLVSSVDGVLKVPLDELLGRADVEFNFGISDSVFEIRYNLGLYSTGDDTLFVGVISRDSRYPKDDPLRNTRYLWKNLDSSHLPLKDAECYIDLMRGMVEDLKGDRYEGCFDGRLKLMTVALQYMVDTYGGPALVPELASAEKVS
ncbi:hypothetical protein ACFLYT_01890 [Nanoarchaeota archaeon]